MIYTKTQKNLMPWLIEAGNDGLSKDCVLVASMVGAEMMGISLHVVEPPKKEEQ